MMTAHAAKHKLASLAPQGRSYRSETPMDLKELRNDLQEDGEVPGAEAGKVLSRILAPLLEEEGFTPPIKKV
jgi:hypothetical protein